MTNDKQEWQLTVTIDSSVWQMELAVTIVKQIINDNDNWQYLFTV